MKIERRTCRERALQLLCQLDLDPPADIDEATRSFWELESTAAEDGVLNGDGGTNAAVAVESIPQRIREQAEEMAHGAWQSRAALDARLSDFVENWSIRRLGTVERNVLRLGAWELENRPDVPRAVIVNEAVDLAKYFSSTGAGKFVNGVLDKLARALRPGEQTPRRRKSPAAPHPQAQVPERPADA